MVRLEKTVGDAIAVRDIGPPLDDRNILRRAVRNDLLGEDGEMAIELLAAVVSVTPPGGRVLEVKAQAGVLSELLKHGGFEAVALEMQPQMVELDRGTFDVPVIEGPFEGVSGGLGTFSTVVLVRVVGHVPDPAGTIRAATELLESDGVLILTDRALVDPSETYEQMAAMGSAVLEWLNAANRIFLYTEGSLKSLAEGLDYRTEKLRHIERLQPPPVEGRPNDVILSLRKGGKPLPATFDPDSILLGTSAQRITSLIVSLRQDLLRLNKLRDEDRRRGSEQLERFLKYPPEGSGTRIQPRWKDVIHGGAMTVAAAKRFRQRLRG